MGFTKRIQYFLVHRLPCSNKEALRLIKEGKVLVDGLLIAENEFIDEFSEIEVAGKIVREKTKRQYVKFNKPAGFESTLNEKVKDNLSAFFTSFNNLSIAGRLDKNSRGLLLLSNDGSWVENICHPNRAKEKEYLVVLDKEPDKDFLSGFQKGLSIGEEQGTPCFCEIIGKHSIRVILTEGKNRQIRRMCYRLGYQVKDLLRVRIHTIQLGDLQEGHFREI